MTIEIDTSVVRGGAAACEQLASDVNRALEYFDAHIDNARTWAGGALIEWLLAEHAVFTSSVESGILGSKKLVLATCGALGDIANLFDRHEHEAQVGVRRLLRDIDPTTTTSPLDAFTDKQALAFDSPAATLATPESPLADERFKVVWDVLDWPDLLSLGNWARDLINLLVQVFRPDATGGQDVFEFLAQKIGGDWDKVALSGDAFGHVGSFFKELAATLQNIAIDVLGGWAGGEGADRAGEYFAELVTAFAAQPEVYADLAALYTKAAWAAFGACSAMLSALDALADAVIAVATGVSSVAELFGAIATLGGLAPAALISAITALVQAFSSGWGMMITALSATIAVGAALGSVTSTIEFIPLPEA